MLPGRRLDNVENRATSTEPNAQDDAKGGNEDAM